MAKKLVDMAWNKSAVKLSGLNAGLQSLINAIYAGEEEVTISGTQGERSYFFNHGDNRDPATNGGATPGDVTVSIYYQPASAAEYKAFDTIDDAGFLSGRRRLAVRVESGRHGGDDLWAFYLTNHPAAAKGAAKNNNYGTYTPVNMSG